MNSSIVLTEPQDLIKLQQFFGFFLLDYNNSAYGTFTRGWTVLGGKKDSSDFEWAAWGPYLYYSVPWLCANFVGAEIFRYFYKEVS